MLYNPWSYKRNFELGYSFTTPNVFGVCYYYRSGVYHWLYCQFMAWMEYMGLFVV